MRLKTPGLLLSSFLIFSLIASIAQTEGESNSFIGGIASVIFIVIFVVLLLALGGVLKKPTGARIPGFLILFIILVIILFVIPMFIPYPQYLKIPESFKIAPLPPYAAQFFQMLGLPSEWMYVPAIIYLFILPFAAIYTLVWAFLQSLGIFTNVPSSVNRVLAFIVAFLTIPMGWFVKLVWVLFSFMGAWSVIIFVATFVVGVFFRGLTKSTIELQEYKGLLSKRRERKIEIVEKFKNAIKNEDAAEIKRLSQQYAKEADLLSEKAANRMREIALSDEKEDKDRIIKLAKEVVELLE